MALNVWSEEALESTIKNIDEDIKTATRVCKAVGAKKVDAMNFVEYIEDFYGKSCESSIEKANFAMLKWHIKNWGKLQKKDDGRLYFPVLFINQELYYRLINEYDIEDDFNVEFSSMFNARKVDSLINPFYTSWYYKNFLIVGERSEEFSRIMRIWKAMDNTGNLIDFTGEVKKNLEKKFYCVRTICLNKDDVVL